MSLAAVTIRRPIFTTMVTLIVVLLGLFSLQRLRIDLLPSIELPTLTVRTQYPGASPEVMERQVTRIIEEIIATVPGVEELTSTSSEGNSSVRVRFAWGRDIDSAALDVLATLEDEINELPDEVVRPRVSKFDIDSFPVVILGIASQLDPVALTTLVEDELRPRFARLPGVAQVDVWGGYPREVRVGIDPERLTALGLTFDEVITALRDANLDRPAGKLDEGRFEVVLRAPAEFLSIDEIRNSVIAVRDGAQITLAQLARVEDTFERITRIVRVNGELGLRVAIRKQAEANTVEVAQQLLAAVDAVNRDYPQLQVVPVTNQGNFIERSIANVAQSVLYGSLLAVLVLLFFLRTLRTTTVIAVAIPIAVVATFALLEFGGLTINLMTLGGLALGVGMMVDGAVVVLENIFRRRQELGESAAEAAQRGSEEVASAIIASTVTTLVIFLPLIFLGGVSGLLFQELALVIVFALLCALLVALSLVPMLAARLLRRQDGASTADDPHTLAQVAEQRFQRLSDRYLVLLRGVLRWRWLTLLCSVALLAVSLLLLPLIGSEFLPPSDEGEVRISGKMELGTQLEQVDAAARQLEALVYPAVPELVAAVTSVGASGWRPGGGSSADLRLTLTAAAARERSNSEIAADLRRLLDGQIAGMKLSVRAPQGQFLLQRLLATDSGLTIQLRGADLVTLDALATLAAAELRQIPGISDVDYDPMEGVPQQTLRIDRAKLADLGLTPDAVTELLEIALAGRRAGEYRSEGNAYPIRVELADAEQRQLSEILNLTLPTMSGEAVALRNLVRSESGEGPLLIERQDQRRQLTIDANVADRASGSVAAEAQARLDQLPRPAGYTLRVAGDFAEQQQAFVQLLQSLLLATLLVYMVLAAQYESLRDPLVVMAAVPLAAIGVLLMLWLSNTTLNLNSWIGCIMLTGIAVNSAILLVDQAGQLRRQGLTTDAAVLEAGRRRLRPILMTSLTTILALLPLAFGVGEGADAQAPMARAVVGGLIASTLITLFLIPALYSLMHSKEHVTVSH